MYSFFKETTNDQWVRTIDFTASLIGQSSALCLQLPYHNTSLLNFKKHFIYYSVSETPLDLVFGAPFSANLPLVPIVQSPRGLKLPYKLLFKVCSLVQMGGLSGMNLNTEFFELVNPQRYDIKYIEHALGKMAYLKESCYDPVAWLREQYAKYQTLEEEPKPPTICLDDGLVYILKVFITPTRVFFGGPEVINSNRVLRHFHRYSDNFLWVQFLDEEFDNYYSKIATSVGSGRTELYERVLSILRNGIRIGENKFDFLAFSSNQLRENSLWMFAPTYNLNADDIRQWMGDFSSIRNVATYALRLGQSLGSSIKTMNVDRDDFELIPDVKDTSYTFSDGFGKISSNFAQMIASKCGVKDSVPSSFQIRYGGYKRIVAVDPTSSEKLSLRPSMLKYESNNPTKLDVEAWSRYGPCFLNRQIITLLSTFGVSDDVFEAKQREVVAQLDAILVDPLVAHEVLDSMSTGEEDIISIILKEVLKCGYKPDDEPFLSMMLRTFRSSNLYDLRVNSRIFIPQARQMMGCIDETGTLEYGQMFLQVSATKTTTLKHIITGNVVVAKNVCLHPRDVCILTAVDVPALHHMVNCVVFPQKGMGPYPNECSVCDLDEDIYFVCWDTDLIPPRWFLPELPPIYYYRLPNTQLDREVTINDVEEHFTNYIIHDNLEMIVNAHTVFADKEQDMALSRPCLELAKLFSVAVDFPQTGIPAQVPHHLCVEEYPDFMEMPDKITYVSERVIGKLFRGVKGIAPAPHTRSKKSFTREEVMNFYDHHMEVDGFRKYIVEAFKFKSDYDYKLGNLMDRYCKKTEAEILSDAALSAIVKSLRNEARSWFKSESEDANAIASAWYHVTYHPHFWGRKNKGMKWDYFISFPWCIYDKLAHIKRENAARAPDISSLERRFEQFSRWT